jgi:putative ABC transport system permease protein
MKIKHTLNTAIKSLIVQKSRSVLTILGIVIGVAAIIIVMALGSGAQNLIVGQISNLGAESVVVQSGDGSLNPRSRIQTLTVDDYESIIRPGNVPNLASATPIVAVTETISYQNNTYRPPIFGSIADFFIESFNIYPVEGIPFSEEDIRSRTRVALIGQEVKKQLFNDTTESVVGETIKIGDQRFRIGGVFPQTGRIVFFDVDELVLIPYTTAQTYLTGENTFIQINLRADSPDNVEKLVFDATNVVRQSRNIGFGEEDDFRVQTQQGLVDQVGTILTALTAFLVAVVAISLVVGGVGVMNIMLVSVTERTKEIGLRKALGATKKDILQQFLFESVILTSIGGLLGILIGTIISYLAAIYLSDSLVQQWQFVFPIEAAFLGVGVSAVIGLIFGIYPASKAAKKNPIEALRYE